MKKRTAKQTAIRLLIALAAIIVLIIIGTVLRMNADNTGFFEAMGSFLKTTFAGK